jgi:hypothetical protein
MTTAVRALGIALIASIAIGCAGAMAESREFVYGPFPGADEEVFERLTGALTGRGAVILESDEASGRVVVAVRSVRGANGAARVVFQCYRGGWVRSSLEGAEPDASLRIRAVRPVRDGYEEVVVGVFAESDGTETP